ncbi:tetratricopeptide repeat protein [Arenibacter sp. GZD96]|uniref:tetratricopeptide repeat-containing sensor histidine kinase n=1 Tax=Aurantibrevibacter litoralis TaxID=3106030 RepID=UPI002AFE92EE|nr:tetratricopeptide repeat protein [Arenibacter sp. GZD-96]MEA1787361.1 tetratricopeptide repeat protein [Arenibacter sp. GZD-96]
MRTVFVRIVLLKLRPTGLLWLIVCILLLWFGSCNLNQPKASTAVQNAAQNDSVTFWVAQAKEATTPTATKAQLLQKSLATIQKYTNDSAKIEGLSQISLLYLDLNDSAQFRKTNKETLQLALDMGDSTRMAEAHWDLAQFFRNKAQQDSAYAHFTQAQKIYSALGEQKYSGTMLFNMAIVQADIKDYTGSEITTIRAIEILKPISEYLQLYKCYNNLGLITIELKENTRALDYFNTALEYLAKLKDRQNLVQVTTNNIGLVYQESGDHAKAIPYFKEVLSDISLPETEPLLYGRALNNLAYSSFKQNQSAEASTLFSRAVQWQDSIGDIPGIARTHYNMATYFLEEKDTVSGLYHAQEAKKAALESNNNKRLLQTLKLFPHLDPKNMYAYVQEYMALDDSLQQEERRVRDKFARISFETDEVLQNNQLLAKQRELWSWIAIGSMLLSVAFVVIIDQRRRNLKLQFQRQQQETNEEIFELMLAQKGKLEEGKHIEQQRVSEELHDNILSQMLGIRLMLSGLNNKTDAASIEKRAALIKKSQQLEEEIRTISHELHAASLQKLRNFIVSIEALLDSVSEANHLKTDFEYDTEVDWDQLKGAIKINLYRIVQEALQNCVKYARAKNISISFYVRTSILYVTIADDGRGFDVARAKRGIGMKNISSRIKKMGGSWHINSALGQGTIIHLEIPVENFVIPTAKAIPMHSLQNI